MTRSALSLAIAGALFLETAELPAQISRATETPFRPLAGATSKGPGPESFSQHYVTAVLTAAGQFTDGTGASVQVAQSAGFQFPSVRFTISVASNPSAFAEGVDPGGRARAALRRLQAHVRAQALGADGQAIAGDGAMQTLALSPSERATSAAAQSNASSEMKEAASILTSRLGHIGTAVTAFESAFHRSPPITQMAYQSAADQFGWRWSRAANDPIDGIHYTAALLQVPASATSLRLSVEILSDWEHAGAWVKTYDLVLSLK